MIGEYDRSMIGVGIGIGVSRNTDVQSRRGEYDDG